MLKQISNTQAYFDIGQKLDGIPDILVSFYEQNGINPGAFPGICYSYNYSIKKLK